jgi:DNA-binding MarR family transcriptional regulator
LTIKGLSFTVGPMTIDRTQLATPTLMRAARGTYARSIRAHLQEIGVTDLPRNGAFILFGVLSGDGARAELPTGLGVSKQAVSQVIDVLVTRGYLDRRPDDSDRRRVVLELTERGHEVAAAVWRGTEAIDEQLASRVSPEQMEAMRASLIALADMKAETPPAPAEKRRRARGFRHFSPIFPVRDMGAALAHYATLGFRTFADEGGEDYGFANRDGLGIHLALEPGHDPASTYLYVRDADALFEEWSQPGIGGLTRPVGPMPYGLREGSHIDPDGNEIRFGSEVGSPVESSAPAE